MFLIVSSYLCFADDAPRAPRPQGTQLKQMGRQNTQHSLPNRYPRKTALFPNIFLFFFVVVATTTIALMVVAVILVLGLLNQVQFVRLLFVLLLICLFQMDKDQFLLVRWLKCKAIMVATCKATIGARPIPAALEVAAFNKTAGRIKSGGSPVNDH